jgi:hypothetical protein
MICTVTHMIVSGRISLVREIPGKNESSDRSAAES